jgi:hypothetical protein
MQSFVRPSNISRQGRIATDLDRILAGLEDPAGRVRFGDLPNEKNVYYAVWVDLSGANELSTVSPEPIRAGIVYVGNA